MPQVTAVFRTVLDAMGRMPEGAHTIEQIATRVHSVGMTRSQTASALSNHINHSKRVGTAPAIVRVSDGVYRLNTNGDKPTPKVSNIGDTLFEYVGTYGEDIMVRGDMSNKLFKLLAG